MIKSIINYIEVSETLSTSGQPTKNEFKIIAEKGFEVVINLAMHNNGALQEEDKIVCLNGMSYIHLPVLWEEPSNDKIELFLHLLKSLQDQKKKVYVHCIMNYRASIFVYLYKKMILGNKNAKLIAPKDFVPNETWITFMKYHENRI